MRLNKVWMTLAGIGLLLFAGTPVPAIAVFSPLAEDLGVPQVDQPSEPGVRRSRLVSINTASLPRPGVGGPRVLRQADLTLELFPDAFVDAMFERFDTADDNGLVWIGRVRGDARSTVTLVYGNGRLTGSVNASMGTFAIRPAAPEMRAALGDVAATAHEIVEIDQAELPREGEPIVPDIDASMLAAAADAPMADTADQIDVLVVYTELARARWGNTTAGIEQLIALGASETNTSYLNAGITQRVRVVHAAQVPFVETNQLDVALPQLRAGTAPGLEGVAELRNRHGADLVMLIVQPPTPNYCGIAYLMSVVSTAFAPSGYSVVHSTCISPGLTFAHELGHNMGAHHDWYVAASTQPYTYAHGYVDPAPGQRWRTVMAYPDLCTALGVSCRRLVSWSNPDASVATTCDASTPYPCHVNAWLFPGAPQGVPAGTRANCRIGDTADTVCDADNRRALNNTALTVANLRQAVVSDPSVARARPR